MSARSVASIASIASVAILLTAAVSACSSNPPAGANAGDASDASIDDGSLAETSAEVAAETSDASIDGGDSLVGDYSGVIAGSGGVGGSLAFTVAASLGEGVPDGVSGVMDLPMFGGLLPISGALNEETLTLSLDATSSSGEVVCTGTVITGPIYVVSCKLGVATFAGAYANVTADPTALCGTLSTTGSATPLGVFDLLVVGTTGYAVYGTTNDTIASGALPGTVGPAVASPVATATFPWGTGSAQVDLTLPDPTSGNGTWSDGMAMSGTFSIASSACPSTAPPDAGPEVGAEP